MRELVYWKGMMKIMELPKQIERLIAGEPFHLDGIGMSGSSVLLFQDKVLKVQEYNRESENEWRMMGWLRDKVPVPLVLAHEVMDGRDFLLMGRCGGAMACEVAYMEDTGRQVSRLAKALTKLWEVDITDCPADQTLKNKLLMAKYNVEHGLVDMDNVDPGTFGEGGFKGSEELLRWLYENQPEEELVLSHGDFCLPNLFFQEDEVSGYIDLGKTGIADKWCDIALCCRSLSDNYSGKYQGEACGDFDDRLLFRELGVEPNREKIRYYLLLDELF